MPRNQPDRRESRWLTRSCSLNGTKVDDAQAFNAALMAMAATAKATLEIVRGSAARTVELPLLAQARAVNLNDQSLLFNPLLVHLRHRLAFAANTPAEPVLRLNIGIALMRLANWEEARQELERATLPDAAGVSQGTVLYLSRDVLREAWPIRRCHSGLEEGKCHGRDCNRRWRADKGLGGGQTEQRGPLVPASYRATYGANGLVMGNPNRPGSSPITAAETIEKT